MVKLTEEERKIYDRKRSLIYNRMPKARRLSPIIRLTVDKNLVRLIKRNRVEFISEMYIDYIENLIEVLPSVKQNEKVSPFEIYYKHFYFDYTGDFYKRMTHYANYLINTYEKTRVGYHKYQDETNYYETNYIKEDNKRILELADYLKKVRGPYRYGNYYSEYSRACKNLLAYIFTNDELLLNKELCINLFNYLRDNYDEFCDYYKMNDYNDSYEYHDYDLENDEKRKDRVVFVPREFIKKYNNRLDKKVIR